MIYQLAFKLNEELLKDDIILDVKEKEEIMNNNLEFIKLIVAYDTLKTEINDLERFNVDIKDKQKVLYELKLKIDNLKVVKDYNDAYKKAREYLKKVAEIAFDNIDEELKLNSII